MPKQKKESTFPQQFLVTLEDNTDPPVFRLSLEEMEAVDDAGPTRVAVYELKQIRTLRLQVVEDPPKTETA